MSETDPLSKVFFGDHLPEDELDDAVRRVIPRGGHSVHQSQPPMNHKGRTAEDYAVQEVDGIGSQPPEGQVEKPHLAADGLGESVTFGG